MKRARPALILMRHAYTVWRAGQLRFRLETFGLYYPSPPYAAPWWKVSPRGLALLARRAAAYARWVVEMETVRTGGPAAWWDLHHPRRMDDRRGR